MVQAVAAAAIVLQLLSGKLMSEAPIAYAQTKSGQLEIAGYKR